MPRASRLVSLCSLALCSLPSAARAEPPPSVERPPLVSRGPLRLSLGAWRGVSELGAGWGAGLQLAGTFRWLASPPGAAAPPGPAPAAEPERVAEAAEQARLAPALLRGLLRAAWRAAGLDLDPGRLAARARASALLPELRLRVMKTSNQALQYTPSDEDDPRAQATGQATSLYEARVSFRLDRLLFADEEVALERLRLERAQQRAHLAQRVIELVSAWQRARVRAAAAGLTAEERGEAAARELTAATALDALTDGAWSELGPGAPARPAAEEPAQSMRRTTQ